MNKALCIEAEYLHQKLVIEFIELEERTGSANLRFEFTSNSVRQQLKYIRTASWVAYEAIDQFLKLLEKGNFSTLIDLSDYPVLEIQKIKNEYWLTINPHDERESREAGEMRLELLLGVMFPQKLSEAINEFPKWW
jgi:hypothetical protein